MGFEQFYELHNMTYFWTFWMFYCPPVSNSHDQIWPCWGHLTSNLGHRRSQWIHGAFHLRLRVMQRVVPTDNSRILVFLCYVISWMEHRKWNEKEISYTHRATKRKKLDLKMFRLWQCWNPLIRPPSSVKALVKPENHKVNYMHARVARCKKYESVKISTFYKVILPSPVYKVTHFYSLQVSGQGFSSLQGYCFSSSPGLIFGFYRLQMFKMGLLRSTRKV